MACSCLCGSASSNCLIDPVPLLLGCDIICIHKHWQAGVQIGVKILSIDRQTVAGLSLSDIGMRMGGPEGRCVRSAFCMHKGGHKCWGEDARTECRAFQERICAKRFLGFDFWVSPVRMTFFLSLSSVAQGRCGRMPAASCALSRPTRLHEIDLVARRRQVSFYGAPSAKIPIFRSEGVWSSPAALSCCAVRLHAL